jgi:Mn-dependent DtxR family transcriptional regulator
MSHNSMTSKRGVQVGKRSDPPPGGPPLTAYQKRFLKTIERFAKRHGTPPLLVELAEELGVTKGTVSQMVHRLRRRGYIRPGDGKYRNLRVA